MPRRPGISPRTTFAHRGRLVLAGAVLTGVAGIAIIAHKSAGQARAVPHAQVIVLGKAGAVGPGALVHRRGRR